MFDYEMLKIIWWALVGFLLIGFVLTDGFDLGVGGLLRLLGRSDDERRVILNCVGPTWDGNQVWLVLGAGAIFAAWPLIYASAFSILYPAMLAALFALFFRPTGFEYRSKLASCHWRNFWDWGLTVGGLLPALVFGIAFGIMLTGLPYHFDREMRVVIDGGILDSVSAFSLLSGLVAVAMVLMHGAAFLNTKTRAAIQQRARRALHWSALILLLLFSVAGVWVAIGLQGHVIEQIGDINTAMAPTAKTVTLVTGGWMENYYRMPWMWSAPMLVFIGAAAAVVLSRRPVLAFVASGFAQAGVILTAGFALFPFMLPSMTRPDHGLTVWDASSSEYSLALMLVATAVFMPLIIAYTSWVYRVLRGPVRVEDVQRDDYGMY